MATATMPAGAGASALPHKPELAINGGTPVSATPVPFMQTGLTEPRTWSGVSDPGYSAA